MLKSRLLVLFLLVGVLLINFGLAEDCDLTNHFVDSATEECVCDFGNGYVTHAVTYGSVCAKDSDSITAGKNRNVSSCGVFSYSGGYFLTRDIDVANDPYFKEHGVCFVVGTNNLNFNLNGHKLTNTNSPNFNDLTGIAVSGSGFKLTGSSEGVGHISGFSGAGIYIYSASQNNKIENLNISKNRIGIYFGKSSTAVKSSSISNIIGSENDYGLVVNLPNSFRNSIINLTNFGMDNYKDVSISQKAIPISTCQELQNISNLGNACSIKGNYKLVNNIDCSDTINWNNGQGFIPIGNADGTSYCGWSPVLVKPFEGILDGQGYKISGLYINRSHSGMNTAGLFHQLKGTVMNLNLENVTIINTRGSGNTGAIAGVSTGGDIINSSVSGSISSKWTIGGLVGGLVGGQIINSYANVNLYWMGYYTTSSNYPYLGGLIGYSVSRENNGGIRVVINNSYFNGVLSNSLPNVRKGGIVGSFLNGGIIQNSYSTFNVLVGETIGQGYTLVGDIVSSYNINLTNVSTFVGWDSSVWNLRNGQYPSLIWQNIPVGTISDFNEFDTSVVGNFGGMLINSAELIVDKANVVFPDKIYFSDTSKLTVYDSGSGHGNNETITFKFASVGESLSIEGERGISLLDAISIYYSNGLSFDADIGAYPELNVPYDIVSFSHRGYTSSARLSAALLLVFKNLNYFSAGSIKNPVSFSVKGFRLCASSSDCAEYGGGSCVNYRCQVAS